MCSYLTFFFNVRIQVTKKIALSRENRDIHLLFKRENFYFLNFSLGIVLKDVLNFSQNVLTNDVLIKKCVRIKMYCTDKYPRNFYCVQH